MPGGDSYSAIYSNFEKWVGEPIVLDGTATAVQLPDIDVPDGIGLFIVARSTNGGNIFFGATQPLAENASRRMLLAPGEGRTFFVTNAKAFWAVSAAAGDILEVMVESGKGGRTGVIPAI
jgi:hypothetical protein